MSTEHPMNEETDGSQDPRVAHRPLLRIFGVLALELIGFGIAIPVLPFLAESLGASATEVGLLFAIQAIGQLLLAPVWGEVSDRFGRKKVLMCTLAAGALASIWTASVGSLAALFAARLIAGMAAANVSTASAYITDVTTRETRSKGMALIGISFGVGFTFGPAVGAILAGASPETAGMVASGLERVGLGWMGIEAGPNLAFAAAALISLFNVGLAGVLLGEPLDARKRRESRARQKGKLEGEGVFEGFVRKLKASLQRRETATVLGIALMYSIAVTIMEASFAYYAKDAFSYGPSEVGMILAGLAVLMGVVQGGVGRMSQRIGDVRMTAIGLGLLAIGLIVSVGSLTVAWLVVFLGVASIGRALAQPGLLSLVSRSAPDEESGQVMGLYQSASSLGRVVGPAMGGIVYDIIDMRAPFVLSGVVLCVALLGWKLRRGEKREPEETSLS